MATLISSRAAWVLSDAGESRAAAQHTERSTGRLAALMQTRTLHALASTHCAHGPTHDNLSAPMVLQRLLR